MSKISNVIRIMQRTIINQKQYFKESQSIDVSHLCLKVIESLTSMLANEDYKIFRNKESNIGKHFQHFIQDLLVLEMTLS